MTRDDIIRMAREAGMTDSPDDYNAYWTADSIDELERFANLIAAAEREACAVTLETEGGAWNGDSFEIAGAIRARGEK